MERKIMDIVIELFNEEDDDLKDILEYCVSKCCTYNYSYIDDDGKVWYMISNQELPEDDLDDLFEKKIANYDGNPIGTDLEEYEL
jgi:hypothetical protein